MATESVKKEAMTYLRDMVLSKQLSSTTRKAVVARLLPFLDDEEARFKKWKEVNRHILNPTRQKTVERRYIKRIQALKIVIHMLDKERNWIDEEPSFIVKRPKLSGGRWDDEDVPRRKKISP